MNTATLLGVVLGAIIILLFLVVRIKMPAFIAMLLVAAGSALAAGIPVEEVVPVMQEGMGNVLSSVMIVVGLGAILGRIIEVAGGADTLAQKFTDVLGRKRIIAAVTAAAFILGIPVFFDVAFIILAPIVFGFARIAKINALKIGLPVAGVLLTVHVALPPHPGPVADAEILGADVGLMLLLGLPIVAVTSVIGYFVAKRIDTDSVELLTSPTSRLEKVAKTTSENGTSGKAVRLPSKGINAGTIILLILLPILQIMLGTTGNMLLDEGLLARRVLSFVGSSTIALLTGVIVAYLVVGSKLGWSLQKRTDVMNSALPDVAVIVFVTGAGGVFANVLVQSGIGAALSDSLVALNMPIILAAFLISLALRATQGSATVAITTSAGLMAEAVNSAGYSQVETVLVALAIGFGALGLSHINDSGFWIVTKYLGLSVKDGLKKWTALSTIFGVTGFLLTWVVFVLV